MIARYVLEHDFEIRENSTDQMFIDEIWRDNYYFANGFEIKPGDRVLDIGAHIGLFSVLAAKLGGLVTAYEPVPESFQMLVKNTESIKTIERINSAVTTSGGLVGMVVPDPLIENNSGKARVANFFDGYFQIQVCSKNFTEIIDNEKQIDFLKMDIEGTEYELFNSLKPEHFEKIKMISLEWHGQLETGRALEDQLKQNGYETVLNWAYGDQGKLQARRK